MKQQVNAYAITMADIIDERQDKNAIEDEEEEEDDIVDPQEVLDEIITIDESGHAN